MFSNQKRYHGYASTPLLWSTILDELQQFSISTIYDQLPQSPKGHIRLGKLVEQFVLHEFKNDLAVTLIASNYQVQDGTLTIGELDGLFVKDEQPVHLEIVYKFYLYDDSVGSSFLEHWIGPNRRDSLVKKLNKLKHKQLPLLYHPITQQWLKSLGYQAEDFMQYVCFKAQLFLPYGSDLQDISPLNPDCIQGFYLRPEQLIDFKDCKFCIPLKLDWLMDIPIQIDWMTYEHFSARITEFMSEKSAPLCWIKRPNGETTKCFVIWW